MAKRVTKTQRKNPTKKKTRQSFRSDSFIVTVPPPSKKGDRATVLVRRRKKKRARGTVAGEASRVAQVPLPKTDSRKALASVAVAIGRAILDNSPIAKRLARKKGSRAAAKKRRGNRRR